MSNNDRFHACKLLLVAALATPALAFGHPFLGEWTATASTPGGGVSETLSVVERDDGYAITAKLDGAAGNIPTAGPGEDIVLDGDSFSYKRTVGALEIVYEGVVSGNTFTGTATIGPTEVPYNGVRVSDAE